MSPPVQGARDYLPSSGDQYIVGELPSDFAKDLYENYALGGGGYTLTPDQFGRAASVAASQYDPAQARDITLSNGAAGESQVVNFYSDAELAAGLGNATVYFQEGRPVGLFDIYDFDPRPWGTRDFVSESQTRIVAGWTAIRGYVPFNVTYGIRRR